MLSFNSPPFLLPSFKSHLGQLTFYMLIVVARYIQCNSFKSTLNFIYRLAVKVDDKWGMIIWLGLYCEHMGIA
jgi:hypothetical protein